MEDVFAALDEDDSGTLSSRELKRALRRLGVDVEEGERQALISALDANGSGQVHSPRAVARARRSEY